MTPLPPEARPAEPPRLLVAALLGAAIAARFLAIAASPGEIDEAVFSGAVTRFDLFDLSPQAPGFPLWILIGRALLPLVPSPFQALAVASTLLSALALPALFLWGRRLVGGWAALGGTLFAAFLPVVWVNGGRAFSDTPATALFLVSVAAASALEERLDGVRHARLPALLAGLAAAAGAGVRPHLVLAFGPLLLALVVRLARRREGRDAAAVLVVAGLAGTLGWGLWLLGQAGGGTGLVASLGERAEFRAHAFATGTLGTILDSFLVRDFLSWRRAAVVLALAVAGLVATARRAPRAAADLLLVLVPTFLSLWFLHSRAMSRYSVPFAFVLALAVAAGAEALFRRRPLALAAVLAGAALFARDAWPVVRDGARLETPPTAAIDAVARYGHPGRETIVADGVFHAFLRTERWEGRLGIWGLSDEDLLHPVASLNRRFVRIADFSDEPDAPDREDPGWRIFFRGGRVEEALGNRRLLAVGLRDPAPPLFAQGFGIRERAPGRPSFRWAGATARLIVPGLQGPPVALLRGERQAEAGATTLTVTDAETGRVLVSRKIEPGPFELAIVPVPVYGPLPRPREVVLSCDRPQPLEPLPGVLRPKLACVTVREATFSAPPESVWERLGEERVLDFGRPRDAWASLEGFHDRQVDGPSGLTTRWTSSRSSFVWLPEPGFAPREIAFRAKAPGREPVRLSVSVGGVSAGTVDVPPGDFSEVRLAPPESARALLAGAEPVRVEISSPVFVPKAAGLGDDPRELGVVLDRVVVR
ncbi:MAG: hypothetical protein U0529_09740 [Thermoanaerobaculia bacterium]